MASVGEPSHSKRPHVKTEKMQDFMKKKEESSSPHKLLRCPLAGCDKVLTSCPGLRYHIKTHSGPDRPFFCNKCNKKFKSANGLKYHNVKTKCEPAGDACGSHDAVVTVSEDQAESAGGQVPSRLQGSEISNIDLPDDSLKPPPLNLRVNTGTNQLSFDSVDDPSPAPIPTASGEINRLTELAIIATSPQSPLMQKTANVQWEVHKPRDPVVRSLSQELHSYSLSSDGSIPPLMPAEDHPEKNSTMVTGDPQVTSSSLYPVSSDVTEASDTWSHLWPKAVWQCFISGTGIKFVSGSNTDWQLADDIAQREALASQANCCENEESVESSLSPSGVCLLRIDTASTPDTGKAVTQLYFITDVRGQSDFLAECAWDHPFFVKDKGWSSYHPGLTAEHYGIPCSELEAYDVCLPPSHPDATFASDVFESFKSFDFTAMDSSAVFTLSSMAKQRRDHELSPTSNPASPTKRRKGSIDFNKVKRPMNGFMLFAKKFRLEYTQQYPGNDNRAISVLLGDKWKRMTTEEKEVYALEAKGLAEQQKKANPDCWKRKK